ncbi:cell division protein FtsQ/DivIB [uncultured Sphingomonas sp.]|uniref:cell division protein FtsQ/DivIB n=1 Tax=uncultured Sphingomonas sp. TaxID=158754 RepID=UPI0026364A80|nr:cell division protein FtsQ/DivIB [uncultured Sphingomonas sp.]
MSERARIRRGAQPRQARTPAVARRGAAAANARAKQVTGRALAISPLPAAELKNWLYRLAALIVALAIVATAFALHLPQFVGAQLGELAGKAGFSVKRVEIQGIHHMDRLPVYSVALDQNSTAMPLVDLGQIRDKLMQYGWVADARVSRRLPDTLLVDIVERQPSAIWQYQGKLSLIDKDGVVLQAVDPQAMPDLPIVIGPGANLHATSLAGVMEAASRLKPLVAGASWVGDRRWDIRFNSGETLALPEGDQAAKDAYAKFDRMDQAARLLGQGFVHFDMRLPGKTVVRVSQEPGHQIGDPAVTAPATPPAPAGTDAI